MLDNLATIYLAAIIAGLVGAFVLVNMLITEGVRSFGRWSKSRRTAADVRPDATIATDAPDARRSSPTNSAAPIRRASPPATAGSSPRAAGGRSAPIMEPARAVGGHTRRNVNGGAS